MAQIAPKLYLYLKRAEGREQSVLSKGVEFIGNKMQDPHTIENDFIGKATEIILENISDEKFGVSELARAIGMSRSNLLRRINKLTKLSASQFIRQVRLREAMKLLKETSLNVSEISYQVGFASTSYFIKCFREYYGYPPGEAGKRKDIEDLKPMDDHAVGLTGFWHELKRRKKVRVITVYLVTIVSVIVIIGLLALNLFRMSERSRNIRTFEKSIAVLPFKNDSNDSSNVYLINGLMESILNNLQKIEDLRVISRTSVEKYRLVQTTAPEIADELDVNYLVEGSGQKRGEQVLLNIQLIDAHRDKHIWSDRYLREATDIFALQLEVSKDIANQIQAVITPEEEVQINKIPTDDPVAYDYFLKGIDAFYSGTDEGLEEAVTWFKKAIEHDNEFARAYADIALAYYMMDALQAEKQYSDLINSYADNALLHDPTLTQSLIAKAVYYLDTYEYEKALPYLEKAYEYNPNSALAINSLSDYYANHSPNTEKYLEYALKGIRLDIAANDSSNASFIYLHVSNALLQTGFINEAEHYINKSLEYDPDNLFSELLKGYVLYAQNEDLEQTKEMLLEALKKDTTRLDIIQEIGKVYYYMHDFNKAYAYYKAFLDAREAFKLDLFRHEHDKIGVVFAKMGMMEESEKYLDDFMENGTYSTTGDKYLNLAMLYSFRGDTTKALEQLEQYAQQDEFDIWATMFIEIDPLVDHIKDLPEFKRLMDIIKVKFWKKHSEIKASLQKEGLL